LSGLLQKRIELKNKKTKQNKQKQKQKPKKQKTFFMGFKKHIRIAACVIFV